MVLGRYLSAHTHNLGYRDSSDLNLLVSGESR
jgi:hypothetical protein